MSMRFKREIAKAVMINSLVTAVVVLPVTVWLVAYSYNFRGGFFIGGEYPAIAALWIFVNYLSWEYFIGRMI